MRLLLNNRSHIHGIHSRCADGFHAQVGVFVAAAGFRVHADAPRGFQENIRGGLLVDHHFIGDDRAEQMPDFQMVQDHADDFLRSAGGHGHGDLSKIFLRDIQDGMDGGHLREGLQVGLLFLMRNGDVVDGFVLFLREDFQDVARGNAAVGIKPVDREIQVVLLGDDLPGAPMQWHRVGEGAVAIENQSLDVCGQFHNFMFDNFSSMS